MAGPVAHIICALAILNAGMLKVEDKQAFLVGTSFPDIRYLGVIAREKTHTKKINWHDVANEPSSFKAGMLLHSLVDRVHEKYMRAHKVYGYLPMFAYRSQTLKFVEDVYIYDRENSWQDILMLFDEIMPDECEFNISNDDIQKWHSIIQRYCSNKPCVAHLIEVIQKKQTITNAVDANATESELLIVGLVDELLSNKGLKEEIFDFYNNIVKHLISDEYI